ncbi:MAG: hypothetical protein ACJ765_10275 [Chloroflexota bacterium]
MPPWLDRRVEAFGARAHHAFAGRRPWQVPMAQLNSYRQGGVKNIYGPMLDGDTATVDDAADTATWNTTVP